MSDLLGEGNGIKEFHDMASNTVLKFSEWGRRYSAKSNSIFNSAREIQKIDGFTYLQNLFVEFRVTFSPLSH